MAAAKMKKSDNGENVYSGIFAVADYKSVIRCLKLKMAVQDGGRQNGKPR